MALSVSVATVKAKCRISVTDFDTEISDLIDEQLPAIEFAILDSHIADTGNANLQAALNLGAAEIISGEFLAQTFREPGSAEAITIGELTFGSRVHPKATVADPFGLKEQGWLRLAPFLKPRQASDSASRTDIRYKLTTLGDDEVRKW